MITLLNVSSISRRASFHSVHYGLHCGIKSLELKRTIMVCKGMNGTIIKLLKISPTFSMQITGHNDTWQGDTIVEDNGTRIVAASNL